MYDISIDGSYGADRYLELAARIEWEEQGSMERPRGTDNAARILAAAEPLRG
jgi:hypothetical protein